MVIGLIGGLFETSVTLSFGTDYRIHLDTTVVDLSDNKYTSKTLLKQYNYNFKDGDISISCTLGAPKYKQGNYSYGIIEVVRNGSVIGSYQDNHHWDGSTIYGEQTFKEMTYNFSGIKTGDIINFYGYCTGDRYWETITNFTVTCNLTFS